MSSACPGKKRQPLIGWFSETFLVIMAPLYSGNLIRFWRFLFFLRGAHVLVSDAATFSFFSPIKRKHDRRGTTVVVDVLILLYGLVWKKIRYFILFRPKIPLLFRPLPSLVLLPNMCSGLAPKCWILSHAH
ncbi:hypothetical protein ACJX0J_019828 [Zea mays]